MAVWIGQQKRIIGRVLLGKKVPQFVYRQDARPPAQIRAAGGFQPYSTSNEVSLIDHVVGSFSSGPKKGELTKQFSRWVSTGSYRMLQELDAVLAQRLRSHFMYKIDTAKANADEFYDVNDVLDRAATPNRHKSQREWVKENGIPVVAIVGYLSGMEFETVFARGGLASEENVRWHSFHEGG